MPNKNDAAAGSTQGATQHVAAHRLEKAPAEVLNNEAANKAACEEAVQFAIDEGMDPERARRLYGYKKTA